MKPFKLPNTQAVVDLDNISCITELEEGKKQIDFEPRGQVQTSNEVLYFHWSIQFKRGISLNFGKKSILGYAEIWKVDLELHKQDRSSLIVAWTERANKIGPH